MEALGPDEFWVKNGMAAWREVHRGLGMIVGTYTILFPLASRVDLPFPTNKQEFAKLTGSICLALAADFAISALIFTNYDLVEGAVLKLAANAGSHVAIDLSGVAINRIKNFRPSAITLAV